MSRAINIPTSGSRVNEIGLVWREILTSGALTAEILPQTTLRIKCIATGTISLDGDLACTLDANEIIYLNTGRGNLNDSKNTVTVVATGTMRIQMALDI